MDYNIETVKQLVASFWKKNWKQFNFKLNGKTVKPDSVSSITVQLERGEFVDGCNFHCTALNLRVSINGVDNLYKADFTIKVVPVYEEGKIEPSEAVENVYLNTIFLKK